MARLSQEAETEIDRLAVKIAAGEDVKDVLREAMIAATRGVADGCRQHGVVGQMVAMGIEAELNRLLAQ